MSLITTIDGIPLFSTRREALAWASSNGLTGYHTHTYQGKTGFMGGATHGQVTRPVARQTPTTTSTTAPTVTSTPNTNSGGGGY